MIRIIQGDCIEVLKTLDDNSVDAIVTDPPYDLTTTKRWANDNKFSNNQSDVGQRFTKGFMGKEWDGTGIAFKVDTWKEAIRVLKPGGHLLAFGGTRTYHRMACAIEDAGFEIRDMVEWLYGVGFPKSLNIGKAIDKMGGQSLSWFIDYITDFAQQKNISRKELTMLFQSKNGNPTGWLWNKEHTQGITVEQFNIIKEFLGLPFDNIEETEREIIGRGKAGLTAGTIANFSGEKEFDITKGKTAFEGWGTGLKPAHEPICCARKPLSEKTVAENVLKWGTGGINIDECRVGFADKDDEQESKGKNQHSKYPNSIMRNPALNGIYHQDKRTPEDYTAQGRFPANLIHDGSEEVVALFPTTGKSAGGRSGHISAYSGGYKQEYYGDEKPGFGDSGSAARFFYCAKASKAERDAGLDGLEDKLFGQSGGAQKALKDGKTEYQTGENISTGLNTIKVRKNNHPTVKPIALMEYLIKLITPPNGIVLDPFMGSGTTGVAAKKLGYGFIGIDQGEDYVAIAEARIAHIQAEVKQPVPQMNLFGE